MTAVGGTLAYPELAGVLDVTGNGFYGYDIATEPLGTAGTIRIGDLRETPITVMTRNCVAHDTVPYFTERFERAYTLPLQNFARNVLDGRDPPVTIDDGVEALRVSLAATDACRSGRAVEIEPATAIRGRS